MHWWRAQRPLRPGDILGALTGDGGLPGKEIGKIDIFDFRAYVAVARKSSGIAYKSLREGKIKGRSFKVRKLSWCAVLTGGLNI